MLQAMMQQNVLLYGIGILCILGVVSQVWLWGIYGRMTKDMENERTAKGKFIKQIRQKYGLLKRMGEGSINTSAFIEKSLYQYRALGRNLHQWRKTGAYALALCLMAGGAGYYFSGKLHLAAAVQTKYLWAMAAAAVITGVIYGLTDIRYKRAYLTTGLLDMLENGSGSQVNVQKIKTSIGKDKEERKAAEPKAIAAREPETETVPENAAAEVAAATEKFSIRKGKKAARESKARQDKKELKENLSRIKASMGETAASVEKERNAEILKNMDPEEQERIIREVLKEFLS